MKKLYKISFCLVSVLIIIFSMCPLSAFAVSNPQEFKFSYNQPQLTGNDFYVELLLFNESSRTYHVKGVYFNSVPQSNFTPDVHFTPTYELRFFDDKLEIMTQYENDMNCSYFGVEFYDNNRSPLYFSGLSSTSFTNTRANTDYGSGYVCINFHVYGNVAGIKNRLTSPASGSPNTEFICYYGEFSGISETLDSLYRAVFSVALLDEQIFNRLGDLQTILNNIHSQGEVTQGHIVDILDFIRIVSADVILIRDDLQKQYDELLEQGESLDEVNRHLSDCASFLNTINIAVAEIRDYCYFIWEQTLFISEYIEKIYNILKSGSDKDQPTTLDPTQNDDYFNAENELIGDGASDIGAVINPEFNNNAMSSIWAIIQEFFNTNGKVFGVVLTVLAFGLIALILGR